MNKFENVDIVDSLRRIVNTNTEHYKSDFIYDVNHLKNAAQSKLQRIIIYCLCRVRQVHTVSVKRVCL